MRASELRARLVTVMQRAIQGNNRRPVKRERVR